MVAVLAIALVIFFTAKGNSNGSGSADGDFSPSFVRMFTGSFWSSSSTCPDIAWMRLLAAMTDHSSMMWRW